VGYMCMRSNLIPGAQFKFFFFLRGVCGSGGCDLWVVADHLV
jgi:hypothetical protein